MKDLNIFIKEKTDKLNQRIQELQQLQEQMRNMRKSFSEKRKEILQLDAGISQLKELRDGGKTKD